MSSYYSRLRKDHRVQKLKNRAKGVFLVICGLYLMGAAAACSGKEPVVQPSPTAEAALHEPTPVMQPTQSSWIWLDDSLANASQAEVGAEIYRLVCSACHGDEGQGLTPEWIATWAPEDQNCWQSKCHGDNHPSDGFKLPKYSPPVKGPIISSLFETAFDLYDYVKRTMPWHVPGTMLDEEYWQVTAFLLVLNDIDFGDTFLDADSAAGISLRK